MKNTKDVIEYDITTAAIQEMKKKYSDMKITDAKSDKAVRAARTFMVSKRTAVEKRRLELNDAANKHRRKVNDKAKEITALLLPIEEPLQVECKRVDDEIKARREEKEAKERKRIEVIQMQINDIRIRGSLSGRPSSDIENTLNQIMATEISEEVYQELKPQALEAQNTAVAALEKALADRLQFEKEEGDRKVEAERLEAQRKDQEAAQAKIDEENRKVELAKAEIEEKKAAEIRRIERAEWERKVKEKADKDAKARGQKAEQDRLEKEEEEKEEKARQAAMAPDRDKLIKWVLSFSESNNPTPQLKSKEAKAILAIAKESIREVLQATEDEIEKL